MAIRFILAAFFALEPVALGGAAPAHHEVCRGMLAPGSSAHGVDVSVVQLIATPEKFDGKDIRTIGYLHLELEGNALYLHKEDFDRRLTKNAIWVGFRSGLDTAAARCSDRYTLVEGRFRAGRNGHMGLFSGTIDSIYRIHPWDVQ